MLAMGIENVDIPNAINYVYFAEILLYYWVL